MRERLKVIPTTPAVLRQRHAASAFKVCPLCDALNLRENDECYVCRWGGEFDQGPALVSSRLQAVIDRCPDLGRIVAVEAAGPRGRFAWVWTLGRLWGRVRRMFRRRLDFRA